MSDVIDMRTASSPIAQHCFAAYHIPDYRYPIIQQACFMIVTLRPLTAVGNWFREGSCSWLRQFSGFRGTYLAL